ncbi:MAG: hypothetical protein M3069_26675 [Chloroflexota bacterium]|nr:hypothetical protein [Chloroflexota bacterium]
MGDIAAGILVPAIGAFETVLQVDAGERCGQLVQIRGWGADQAGQLAETPVGEGHALAIGRGEQNLSVQIVVHGQRVEADVAGARQIAAGADGSGQVLEGDR